MVADKGIVAPEILARSVRDEFIAECGRRNMPITRRMRDAGQLASGRSNSMTWRSWRMPARS